MAAKNPLTLSKMNMPLLHSPWLNHLAPDHALDQHTLAQVKTRVFVLYYATAILCCLVCVGINLGLGFLEVALFQTISVLIGCGVLWRGKRHGPMAWAGDILTLCTLLAVLPVILRITGIHSPTAAWFALLPLPAALFQGLRRGAMWTVVSLGLYFGLHGLEAKGLLPWHAPQAYQSVVNAAAMAIAGVFLLSLIAASNLIRQELMRLLAQELDRSRRMIDRMREGVVRLDEHGVIRELNPSALGLLGECLGEPIQHVVPEWSAQKEVVRSKYHHIHQTTPRQVELHQQPLLGEDGLSQGTLVMVHDVTAQHYLMQRLESTRDDAVLANRAKSQFLAMMSHELRTPLNAILGYTELVAEECEFLPQIPETMVEDLAKISGAGRHLLSVVGNILDLSKIESGQGEEHPTTLSLEELLQEVAQPTGGLFYGKEVQFIQRIQVPTDTLLWLDQAKIKQILINLIGNAAKFTQSGHVTLAAFWGARPKQLCFEVQDTGPGMEPHLLHTIFEPFRQIDGTSTRNHDGSGLGLAISHQFATLCQAALTVESTPGKGSTFRLTLPVRAVTGVPDQKETPVLGKN